MVIDDLKSMGLNLMPLRHKDSPDSKKPHLSSWKHLQTELYDGEFPENHNVAVICGAISGNLLVLDIDHESLYDNFSEYHDKTFIVRTGKKGYHIYFKYNDITVKSKKLFDFVKREIDIKAEGGYVVAPGSVHPETKNTYDIVSDKPIMTVDLNKLQLKLQRLGFNPERKTIAEIADGVQSGNRNDSTFKYACYLIRDRGLGGEALKLAVQQLNERHVPPLPDSEIDVIITSALKYEKPVVTNDQDIIPMQQITPEYENVPIKFEGMVISTDERKTYTEEANFKCPNCGEFIHRHCDQFYVIHPPKCPECKVVCRIDYDSRVLKYIQQIRIQEFLENARNNAPLEFDAEILDKNVGEAFMTDRKTFVGKFRSIPSKHYNEIVFEIMEMCDLDQKVGCMPTEEELKRWQDDPNIYDKVVNSIAPELCLRPELKETTMFSMAGGMSLNGKRANIHTAIIGDAQLGKSELLMAVSKIMVGSAYAMGRQASNAGLTVGMAKLHNGIMVPKAGLLPTHTGNLVCLDEVDKMKPEDREGALECMEQNQVTFNKVGYPNTRLPCDTTIIAAGNPKNGKVNLEYNNVMDNFQLEFPFLTRFDILWLLTDTKTVEEDNRIRKSIRNFSEHNTLMKLDELQRFFSYVRSIDATVPDAIRDEIDKLHKNLRHVSDLNELEIGWRNYYGLYRLTSASAKLHLRTEATMEDIETVKRVMMLSIESLKIDGEVRIRSRKQTKDDVFMTVWSKCCDDSNTVDKDKFISALGKSDPFNPLSAPQEFEKYKSAGIIELNNKTGRYRYNS